MIGVEQFQAIRLTARQRGFLSGLFCGILVGMLGLTSYATWDRGMLDAGGELMRYPWFWATLADAYASFLTIYLLIAWREPTWTRRLVWLVLILSLGSIAFSIYFLLWLRASQPQADSA